MAIKLVVDETQPVRLETGRSDSANLTATAVMAGTKDYNKLANKPQIGGVTLEGNKTLEELGLTVDTELNAQSGNPVANSAVVGDLQTKQDALTFDASPTEGSDNPVTSGGVYNGLSAKQDALTFDQTPTEGSNNPVTSDGIAGAIADALETTEPHIDVVLWPLGINAILVGFRGFADYTTFAALAASPEFAVAIQKTVNVYAGTTQNYVGQATIYAGINGGVSANWTIWLADAIYMNGDYADGFSGTVTYDSQQHDWYLANPTAHQPLYFELLVDKENVSNKVQSVDEHSTEDQYPSAKCLYNALEGKQDTLTIDSAPTYQSDNPVASGGVYDALEGKANTGDIPTQTSDLHNDGADGTSVYVEADELATVATSGAYADLSGTPTIPAAQVNSDWNAVSGVAEILNKPSIPAAGIPAGGNAGQVLKKTSATDYDANWADQTQYYPSGYSTTGADKQTKQIACSSWTATAKSYLHILLTHANTYAGKIYFTVNAVNTYEVWINGAVSSSTNYSLPAGTYIIYFDGSAFQVRTDGIIPASVNGTAARIPYGECDSTSTSTAFTATVPGITELKDGVTMLLYNGVVTSASGFTINVNGLGGKPSYSNMTLGNPVTPTNPTRDTTIFNINYAFLFVYSETLVSGGCWIGYRGYDANTNTIGYQLRTNNTTMKTTDKFYRYRLLFTSADGTKWVPANTSNSTNATAARTPNTRAIDPFGEIVWYGTTTAIEADAAVTAAQLWQEYYGSYTAIGYSFNNTGAAQTMTANKPIYIVCTPQADGSAIIDPTTPYTQSLPTTDDGKIYIYLGRAYNATNFEITMNHPVYYHDGTGIRLWTGKRQMPDPPAANGTYTLQCTVNNGAVTYSWI